MKCLACGATVRVIEYASADDAYVSSEDSGGAFHRWPDGYWCFECNDCGWEWEEDPGWEGASEPTLASYLECQTMGASAKRVEDLESLVRELTAYHDDVVDEVCHFCGMVPATSRSGQHRPECPWHWILGASDG